MNPRRPVVLVPLLLAVLSLAALICAASPNETGLDWWAFQSPLKATPPSVQGASIPIDRFLLARLHEKGLDFAPPADRRTLIRRLSFDLTGLPPSQELLGLTYEQAMEKLLASPQYGERWGRHWLDIVRFGETDGGEHNHERFNAWPYRDYVIQAFNQDMPYNQFVREQIAGDILFPGDRNKIAATGFLVAGPWDQVSVELNQDPVMKKTARMDELDDMVTTTCATFLGLTVNCARCHDHKFDPIPARDYYRLTAVFSGAGFGERSVASKEERAKYDGLVNPMRNRLGEIRGKLSEMETAVDTRLRLAKYRAFDESRRAERQRIPINPIYNRNQFAPATASHFRMAILNHKGGRARIDRFQLLPNGPVVSNWHSEKAAQVDQPLYVTFGLEKPAAISAIEWSCDPVTGDTDGAINTYRFEVSDDNKTWRTLCTNVDHISRLELDLPGVSDDELVGQLTAEQRERRKSLRAEQAELESKIREIPTPARIYACNTRKPDKSFLLERGSVQKPVEEVSPGGLSSVRQLPALFSVPADADDSKRRVALADWITDPRNPLTARVIVNRVWYYHFGAGVVNTPSDFGVNGDRPSHQELLDWLAVSFMEHGWSLKWLHRQILTSRAYQQSAAVNKRAAQIDAGNRLLWRMPLKRMDAETLRDSVLWVSGSLNPKSGGPSFALHEMGNRGSYIYHAVENDGPEVWRRAVYRFGVRGGDRTFLDSFDCPDPSVATPERAVSNTPVQALALMNNRFVVRQAGLLAKRLESEATTTESRIKRAYQLAYGRDARVEELAAGIRFLRKNPLSEYCRALLNSNEFIYVP